MSEYIKQNHYQDPVNCCRKCRPVNISLAMGPKIFFTPLLTICASLTVISFLARTSAQYVNHPQRNRMIVPMSGRESMEVDPRDSYLPDPPIIGLTPPLTKDLAARIDRDRSSHQRRRPNHERPPRVKTKSRYRNNFGKGKRMRRPPGPFKVVGKRKTCTFKRKMIKQPPFVAKYRRRSDLAPTHSNTRHGRSGWKRNLLAGDSLRHPPSMKYYENLPNHGQFDGYLPGRIIVKDLNGHPMRRANGYIPMKSFQKPILESIKGLDLNKYRIFIHEYSYGSDEVRPPVHKPILRAKPFGQFLDKHQQQQQQQRGKVSLVYNKNPSVGINKPNLLPSTQVTSNEPFSNTHSILWQMEDPKPVVVVRPIDNNDGDQENKFYSSVIRAKETEIDPPFMSSWIMGLRPKTTAINTISGNILSTGLQSTNSSSPLRLHAALDSSRIGVIERRESASSSSSSFAPITQGSGSPLQQPSTTTDVIYVTPEPYNGDWTEADEAISMYWNNLETTTKSRAIKAGQMFVNGAETRTKVMSSGGLLANGWRPIYPNQNDNNSRLTSIAPNKHWVQKSRNPQLVAKK